jgi:photosystem II stability/assembly factor-like uncharacterized protein
MALGVLAVVTAVLVVLAIRHVRSAADPSPIFDAPSGHKSSGVSPAGRSAASAGGGPQARAFLAVGRDGSLIQATRGDCTDATVPVVQTARAAGGLTARRVPGLWEVLRVQARSARSMLVVGLDGSCQVSRYASRDGGRLWQRTVGDGPTWHLGKDPKGAFVVSPRARRTTPCIPTAVSTPAGAVRVLCADGRILGTPDGGATWSRVGTLPGAVDIAFTSSREAFALAPQRGCPAAVLRSIDGGRVWTQRICLPGKEPRAIAARPTIVAAEVGTTIRRSTDNGATWSTLTAPGAG